jgi:anti-sigma factor RsiW
MKPVDPAEISALLDGELSDQRAAEVRRAIARDESLRQAYEQLAALDGDLKACAAEVMFRPRLSTVEARNLPAAHVLSLAVLALMVRLAVRLLPLGFSLALEAGVLAVVVWWVVGVLIRASEEAQWRLAARAGGSSG